MFGRKKEVKIDNVKNFKGALKAIKTYIYLKEWEKAKHAIEDVKQKEQNAFSELEEKIKGDYREVQKQRAIYNKNIKYILTLEKKYDVEKIKYERKIESERFKIRFTSIKKEIKKLISTSQNNEAINLLTHFLEENKDRSEVVTFYAKEKKKILKSIQKSQKKDKKKIADNAELEALRLA